MYFYAARQPILDLNKKLYGYELLFRDSLDNVFPDIDGDEATSKMIEASKFNMGISEFTNNKLAFINFTLETLIQGYPEMLTNEEVVIEVLETIKPGKRLLGLCKDLHSKDYIIALDDYEHQNVWVHFFPFIKIIKVDFQKHNLQSIKTIIDAVKNYPHIDLLAEKVETYQEYEQAQQLGFKFFQGYYFARPEMVKTKNLSPSQISMAELLYETSKKELDLTRITKVFERDVSLSYKLLRYANSASFKRRSELSTIKQALVILGSSELKRFLGLMFAVTANPDKPTELIKLAMVRAKFCELVTSDMGVKFDISTAFLTGLLSMIDAILDEDLASVLAKLPLSAEIKVPLLTMEKLKLDKEKAVKHYNEALAWADEQSHLAG